MHAGKHLHLRKAPVRYILLLALIVHRMLAGPQILMFIDPTWMEMLQFLKMEFKQFGQQLFTWH